MNKWLIALGFLFLCRWTEAIVMDGHTYLAPASAHPGATPSKLIEALDAAGVDEALTFSGAFLATSEELGKALNDFVFNEAARSQGRFRPFCTVPFFATWSLAELERCASTNGARGFHVNPVVARVDLRRPEAWARLREYLALAEKHQIFLSIDASWGDSWITKELFKESLRYPHVRIILAHAFWTNFRDLWEIVALASLLPGQTHRFFVDLSASLQLVAAHPELDLWVTMLRKFGLERVFFGSDFPVYQPKESLAVLGAFPFTPEEGRGIRGDNLRRFLDGVLP